MITTAAKMAGDWWAARLHERYADKREAFAANVAMRVDQAMRGEYYWDWWGNRHDGDGTRGRSIYTEFDYDPQDLLIAAFIEVIGDKSWEWKDAMPIKHGLRIYPHMLCPKEGYGNLTPSIPVPSPAVQHLPSDDTEGGAA